MIRFFRCDAFFEIFTKSCLYSLVSGKPKFEGSVLPNNISGVITIVLPSTETSSCACKNKLKTKKSKKVVFCIGVKTENR